MEKPKKRSVLRAKCGMWYYAFLRYLLWIKKGNVFAKKKIRENYPYIYFEHSTPLMRKLKDVDMWLQENKVENLKLAAPRLDGLVLQPGEVFSYWRLIGKPTYAKGYKDGMVLKNGGYSRHNELYQLRYDKEGHLLSDELIVKNDAMMMYEPFLEKRS